MRLFAVIAMLFIGTLVFSAENTNVYAQPVEKKVNQTQKTQKVSKKIVIKSGDTLSKIAKKHGSTYPRIFYANKQLKDVDVIYPGEKLRIPSPSEKLKKRPLGETVKKQVFSTPQQQTTTNYNQAYVSKPKPTPSYSSSGGVWDRLAECESGGNWSINTGNGYYGGLQFSASSWRAAGGSGQPHQASRGEQIARGKVLQSRQGWGAWPSCTSQLGIR